jgi:hypothetical protein
MMGDRIITYGELERNGEEAAMSISRYNNGIHLKGLRKTTRNLTQDSKCPGQDLHHASPEQKSQAAWSWGWETNLRYIFHERFTFFNILRIHETLKMAKKVMNTKLILSGQHDHIITIQHLKHLYMYK